MAVILCIDDELEFRSFLAETLSAWGHETIEAGDGVEGLAAILEHHPSIVICDRLMPRMNGFELLQKLRTDHPEAAKIPFVFLTVLSDVRDKYDAAEIRPTAYLSKPVKLPSLRAVIGSILEFELQD